MPTARKPAKRFCIFFASGYLGGGGGCNNVQCVCGLGTHFMLRCTRLLLTDGAPAYPAVAEALSIQHESVNHSKGQFSRTVRRVQRGNPKVVAHAGTIDSCWKACKKMLPGSLSSKNPMIMLYVNVCQCSLERR